MDDEERGTMGKILDHNCAIFNFTKKTHIIFVKLKITKRNVTFNLTKKKLVLVFFNKIGSLSVLDFESRDLTKVLYFVVTKLIGSQFPKVIVSFCKG